MLGQQQRLRLPRLDRFRQWTKHLTSYSVYPAAAAAAVCFPFFVGVDIDADNDHAGNVAAAGFAR